MQKLKVKVEIEALLLLAASAGASFLVHDYLKPIIYRLLS